MHTMLILSKYACLGGIVIRPNAVSGEGLNDVCFLKLRTKLLHKYVNPFLVGLHILIFSPSSGSSQGSTLLESWGSRSVSSSIKNGISYILVVISRLVWKTKESIWNVKDRAMYTVAI